METLERTREVELKTAQEIELSALYRNVFPSVGKLISSLGGSFEDAKDVFHDALILYMEKKAEETENLIRSEKAYILGIAKHLWLRKYQKDKQTISFDDFENQIEIPEDLFPTAEQNRLLQFLKVAGKRCLDLLRTIYFMQHSISKIVAEQGYSSKHSVSAQKYKCLEKVRNQVKKKSLVYEDFTE